MAYRTKQKTKTRNKIYIPTVLELPEQHVPFELLNFLIAYNKEVWMQYQNIKQGSPIDAYKSVFYIRDCDSWKNEAISYAQNLYNYNQNLNLENPTVMKATLKGTFMNGDENLIGDATGNRINLVIPRFYRESMNGREYAMMDEYYRFTLGYNLPDPNMSSIGMFTLKYYPNTEAIKMLTTYDHDGTILEQREVYPGLFKIYAHVRYIY